MRRFLAGALAAQLMIPMWAVAQEPVVPPSTAQQPAMLPDTLRILVLEGQGSINNIEKGLATPPVVEVRDRDDRPVEAATVVFRLPPAGPGGLFPGQQLSKTAMTNVRGQAVAGGLVPNKLAGRFTIHVSATAGNRMGEIEVLQTNTSNQYALIPEAPHRKMTWWKWAIIGGVGAGILVGVIAATHGGSSSKPTVTINSGPVTIGN